MHAKHNLRKGIEVTSRFGYMVSQWHRHVGAAGGKCLRLVLIFLFYYIYIGYFLEKIKYIASFVQKLVLEGQNFKD